MINRSPLGSLLALMFVAAPLGCVAPRQSEGQSCVFNDDCAQPLVCAARRCRAPCRDDRDCVGGYTCRSAEMGVMRVCLPPAQPTPCLYASHCGSDEVCCFGECATRCSAGPCPGSTARNALYQCVPVSDASVSPPIDGAASDGATDAPLDGRGDAFTDGATQIDSGPADAPVPLDSRDDRAGDAGRLPPFVSVCAGSTHSCALSRSGEVYCWGDNNAGALGDGTAPMTTTLRPNAERVVGLTDVVSISCAQGAAGATLTPTFTCAVLRDGAVRCWGNNERGGLGPTTPRASGTPLAVPSLPSSLAVSIGELASCALTTGATVFCWGPNMFYQRGDGSGTGSAPPMATRALLPDFVRSVSCANGYCCSQTLSGSELYCWGANGVRQFGADYPTTMVATPLPIRFASVSPSVFASIQVGGLTGCGIEASGAVRCWGYNTYGVTGVFPASSTTVAQPTPFAALGRARALSLGRERGCAIREDGRVQCWGTNERNALGDPGAVTPARLGPALSIDAAISISVGPRHVCAVDERGAVWCWGENASGQLGVAPTVTPTSATPLRVE